MDIIRSAMPESGQFVAVWKCDGKIYSETLKWEDDRLLNYDDAKDEFIHKEGGITPCFLSEPNSWICDMTFIVA